jgi:AcrR family transcriptional regulator
MGIAERRKREKRMRQRMIQDAALELFMQKGFYTVKMEDISEKAELSIATIYIYFKSKDELYASLIDIALEYLYDRIKVVHENETLQAIDKFMGYQKAMYNTYREHPTILRIIIHIQLYDTLKTLDPKLLAHLNEKGRQIIDIFSGTYEEGVEQGAFKEGHGVVHADILWAIFTGLALWEDSKKKIDERKDFFKETLARAFEVFCQGIQRN